MTEPNSIEPLPASVASAAVTHLGWRYLLGTLCTSVPVRSLSEALRVATTATEVCAEPADAHLRIDLRSDRVELSLQTRSIGDLTELDTVLAGRISQSLTGLPVDTGCATSPQPSRPVQSVEIAIDALDIPAIRPFWKAVLAYQDEPGHSAPDDPIVDPVGQLPAVWFQQMTAPRPDRNRIHLDVTVAHDQAEARVAAALAAGGVLVNDDQARAFWVLADAEGNEACVCTWLDRE
ncbi:MAG TPA: VOC family protein [Jatrophihabitans sp.]|nr:VOC family protein [Jatrophihabitans sp.]